jgi:hypothetical protein
MPGILTTARGLPVGDEAMPSDPFREGQPDWGWLAGNDATFLAAHVAAGMAEGTALELTKVYLNFMLGVLLASASTQQQPDPGTEGE